MKLTPHFPTVFAIVHRQFLVFRQQLRAQATNTIANPLLYLFGFGFGMGAVIDSMEGIPYLAFVSAGIMANTAAFSSGFETGINAFSRMTTQQIYGAILATPARVGDIAAAEIVWAGIRGLIGSAAVLIVCSLFGGYVGPWWSVLFVLPVLYLGALMFAATGLAVTAHAKTFESFSYYFTFWFTPNLVFTGVFFPIDRLPDWLEPAAWLLPMSSFVGAVRTLATGAPITLHFWYMLAYVAAFGMVMWYLAATKIHKRLLS